MQTSSVMSARPVAVAARPAARRCVTVQATSACPQVAEKKQKKAALAAALTALAASVLVSAGPATADEVKAKVCASNPTAQVCLTNSAKQ